MTVVILTVEPYGILGAYRRFIRLIVLIAQDIRVLLYNPTGTWKHLFGKRVCIKITPAILSPIMCVSDLLNSFQSGFRIVCFFVVKLVLTP